MTAHRSKHKAPTKMYYVQRADKDWNGHPWLRSDYGFVLDPKAARTYSPQGASNVLRMLTRLGIPARRVEVV